MLDTYRHVTPLRRHPRPGTQSSKLPSCACRHLDNGRCPNRLRYRIHTILEELRNFDHSTAQAGQSTKGKRENQKRRPVICFWVIHRRSSKVSHEDPYRASHIGPLLALMLSYDVD
jgi:hypothetical protein